MINLEKDLLDTHEPFLIVNKEEDVAVYKGEIKYYDLIGDLPALEKEGVNYAAILPYNQIKERGYAVLDGGEKIIALLIKEESSFSRAEFMELLNEYQIEIDGELSYNVSDEAYQEQVQKIIQNEINMGEGSNFLLSRKTLGKIKDFQPKYLLSVLKRLMQNELDSYWNFLYYTGKEYFIGASPERHLSYSDNKVVMNPICGTMSKLDGKNFKSRLLEFIQNPKEINELFQVVDEELKIICKLCPDGGKILGPYLKEMGSVIHTEYYLEGKGEVDIFWSLKESLYAATMVGSPLESAARIIKRYEKDSRRYYSSVITLFGKKNARVFFDSAITIRTMEMQPDGNFVIQVGASIVRDSVPELENLEIKAKAAGMIKAMFLSKTQKRFLPEVSDANITKILNSRNDNLSKFWFAEYSSEKKDLPYRAVFIDNEDDFIYMLAHIMKCLGFKTRIVHFSKFKVEDYTVKNDVIVIGPGPGNPNNLDDPKMKILFDITRKLIASNSKVFGVCLGHQIISRALGFTLTRSIVPLQGMQKEIMFLDEAQYVGFYNSFFAIKNEDLSLQGNMHIEYDEEDKIVYIQKENLVSIQFHAESIFTQKALQIIANAMECLLGKL